MLQTIEAKIGVLLKRRQLDDETALEDLAARSPELATAPAASIQGRLAIGPRRGQRVTRVGSVGAPATRFTEPSRPGCAAHEGYSLHAGVCVTGSARTALERLCRYVARPAIATERLSELPDGRIAEHLRHPWSDGTTRVVFEPLSFLEELAALIPPQGAHLVCVSRAARGGRGDAAADRARSRAELWPPLGINRRGTALSLGGAAQAGFSADVRTDLGGRSAV